MTRFSIIVPVHDVQGFLGACLDSVLAQTCQDFEVVCVDDGSTDASAAILANRAARDARLRVLTRENGGPSAARNAGMRAARGDYLVFLDADDELEPCALERVAAALDEGASPAPSQVAQAAGEPQHASAPADAPVDAVVFGWSYFPAREADRFVREHARVRDAYYPSFSADMLFDANVQPYLRLAVRRAAWLQSGVAFDEALRVGEDAAFLFALFPRIGAVRLLSDSLYRYRLPHEGSLMARSGASVAGLCADNLAMAAAVFADWKRGGFLGAHGKRLVEWLVREQLYTVLRQPPEMRAPLVGLARCMLRANFTAAELWDLGLDEPAWRLVRTVLAARDDGTLVTGERDLSHALLSWRLAQYGALDLAATAASRAGEVAGKRLRAVAESSPAGQAALPGAGGFPGTPETPLVSVVVPVYNVERYLDQALCSVEAQTLRDIEIICVNDGSTDASPAILQDHAARDSRVRVVDKQNGGYGSACNCGIAHARGTWIAIMEPDDWIDERMYERMCAFAATFPDPPDVVKTPYWRIWMPDTPSERRVNCSYRGRIRPKAQPFKLGDAGTVHLIIHHPSIWSALYRRSFLEERGIRFAEVPGAGWADNPFLAETMCQAGSIAYLDEPFYHYREETPEKTASVARNSWQVSLDRWHDMADVYERLGVENEDIVRAHVRRGFTYVGLVLEYHDIEREEDVADAVRAVFARMDPALVFSEPNVSPGQKRLFARLTGAEMPQRLGDAAYALQVAKGGVYNLVNTGPAMTIDTFRTFVSSHAKREGER